MTSPTPNLDELKRLTEQLLALLNDPHPGLMTWLQAVNETIRKIGEFA